MGGLRRRGGKLIILCKKEWLSAESSLKGRRRAIRSRSERETRSDVKGSSSTYESFEHVGEVTSKKSESRVQGRRRKTTRFRGVTLKP